MTTKKTLVVLAGLMVLTALAMIISCAPATPEKVTVKETVVVEKPVPQTVVVEKPAPTLVPPTAAPKPTEAPKPPVAVLKVVAVPGNASLPNPITATLKYITDTAVGEKSATAAMGTTGLSNVPINVPIRLAVSAADPKNTGKPTWTLVNKPADSKAAFKDPTAMVAEFTPDVVGKYQVSVALKNEAGLTSTAVYAFFNAGTFIGVDAGNCKQCHAGKVEEWAKTGHATMFKDQLDNKRDGPLGVKTHYSETCTRCHTTGWYLPPLGTGAAGFFEAKTKANWTFPTQKQIDAAWEKTGPSNWDNAPAAVKNMANIQCEQCHGPANEHVKNGAKVTAVSMSNGACNVCHAGGGHHVRGLEILNSKHTTGESFERVYGPARQACVRCHSAEGFVTFVANPKNPAAWSNEEGAIGCATCHDPHSEANFAQLRVVGKPVEIPFEVKKDVGLSAICMTCHNARTNPADAIKSSFPHYSSVAELLNDTGGVTYGATVPNSPHSMLVGAAPVPNPAYKDQTTAKFLWSKVGDNKGNIPGPCVVCHMAAGLHDAKDPNVYKVGDHSFNTVSPDGKFEYGAACKSCHGEVKDFNLKAKADYDGNGKVEGVQDEVKGLLNVLWKALEAKGVKKVDTGYPYATLPRDAQGNVDDKIDNAWYNFRTVYGVMWGTAGPGNEGKAQAVHNFKRSVALLQLSLKDLTGSLPAGMTEMK
jgi:hypothetical protein